MDPGTMTTLQPVILALIGAASGVFGVEVIRAVVKREETKIDVAKALRAEMTRELERLSGEVRRLDEELEEWRGKYYALLTDYHELRLSHKAMALELAKLRTGTTAPPETPPTEGDTPS